MTPARQIDYRVFMPSMRRAMFARRSLIRSTWLKYKCEESTCLNRLGNK